MNIYTNGHAGADPRSANLHANPNINPAVRAKVRTKKGNGQSMASSRLSAGIKSALVETRATQAELQKYIAFKIDPFNPDVAAQANAGSTAVGINANANAVNSSVPGRTLGAGTALGAGSTASGAQSIASGFKSIASDVYSTAVGSYAQATAASTTAVGSGASAFGEASISLGLASYATGLGAIALGGGPIGQGVGSGTKATAIYSVALGYTANASASNAIAIGLNTQSTQADAVALGANAQSNAPGALATGASANASGAGSIAVGRGATTQSSGASDDTYAALTMGAHANAVGWGTTAISAHAKATGTWSTALGSTSTASGNRSVALGYDTTASGSQSVALGVGSIADRDSTVSVGRRQIVNVAAGTQGTDVVSVNQLSPLVMAVDATFNASTGAVTGPSYTVQGQTVSTVGSALGVLDTNLTAAKNDIAALQANGVSLPYVKVKSTGAAASATGTDAIAIGNAAQSSQTNNIALGNGAQALAPSDAVAIGAGSLADAASTVSIGNKSTALTRRLVNMKAGGQSTDAVNVSQLQPVVTALGGGASIDATTGAVTGPTYTLTNGGVQTTLSGALNALDQAVSHAGGKNDKYVAINSTGPDALANGTNAIAIGSSASASGSNSIALGMNSIADVDGTVSVGSVLIKRKLVNVAEGDVSATSTDAVTGAQLDGTNQQVMALQEAWNNSGVIDPGTGDTLAVTYSSAAKDTIQLGSAGSLVKIRNVAPAGTPTDAVNLGQLTGAVDGLRSDLAPSLAYVKVNSSGADATAAGSDAVAIGTHAIASLDNTLALGANARASADQAVALGSNSLADGALSVSLGNGPAGLKRKLVNLQAGTSPDDAVAIHQLQSVVVALGGGAAIDPATGAVTGPTYTLANGGVKTSLEDALGALDQAVSESGANNPYLAVNSTGPNAVARGDNAIGLGSGASASGNNAVAIGKNSVADANDTVSVGSAGNERKLVNLAAGDIGAYSTQAINGAQLYATDQAVSELSDTLKNSGLIDPGSGASLAVTYSNASKAIIALGNLGAPVEIMNVADGLATSDAANVGQVTSAVNALRTEVNNNLKYVKVNATGTQAVAAGTNAVAIGSNASTSSPGAVAIGTGADASGARSVALGYNASAEEDDTVSVGYPGGERRITNVADGVIGAGSTDAINGGQLFGALGALTARAGIRDVTAPNYAVEGVEGDNTASLNGNDPEAYTAMAFGVKSLASGANTAAFGLNNTAGFDNSVAMGVNSGTGADQPYSVAVGSKATTRGTRAVAMGANVDANADFAVAVGTNTTQALGVSSIAVGDGAKDRGVSGIAIGKTASVANGATSCIAVGTSTSVAANLSDAIALGTSASVTAGASGGVALGQGAVANRGTAVSLGSVAAGTRQIINLSAGTQATDAVNVTQLQGVTTALGGGASVGADGSVVPPTYTVDGTPYPDVGAAINAVANLTDANAVSYDDTAKDIITLGGILGTRLTNVSAGNVDDSSMDAINGSQLFGTAQSVATILGGGAAVDADGIVTPPVYVINTTTANDVGGALTNLYTEINQQLADAGLIDPGTGQAIAAVTYDGGLQNSVTLGGTGAASPVAVLNVAPGDASSDTSTDAVNGSQLYATNQAISDLTEALSDGGVLDPSTGESLAVTYADASKTDITLGTMGTPVTMTNVKAGALTDTSMEAVNGSQLFAVDQSLSDLKDALDNGGVIDPATGETLAVTYADASKTGITLGTTGMPVTVSNVAEGDVSEASTDIVNGAQLYETNQVVSTLQDTLENSGLIDPDTGESLAVTYDSNSKNGVTLGGTGAAAPAALHNMATGTADTDGVNVAQLTSGLTNLKTELTSGAINLKYIKVNATGTQANANGTNAVSIGSNTSATSVTAVAIGTGASVSGDRSVAVGYNSVADDDDVLSVGYAGYERKIINVAEGDISPLSTDAVNGGQLFAVRKALDALAGTNGVKNVEDEPHGAIEGRSGKNVASLNGGDPEAFTAAALGVFSFANGSNTIAVGLDAIAGADYSVAMGRRARTGADNDYAVAMGADVQTNASRAVALGTRVQANAEHALAVGSGDTWAIGRSAIAMGEGVKVRSDNSIAIGRAAMVTADAIDALALGAEASVEAGAIGGVALGHGAVADRGNAISIGGGSVGTRQIIHVAAGTEPNDAVNVAQLREAMAAMRAEIELLRSQLGARQAGQ